MPFGTSHPRALQKGFCPQSSKLGRQIKGVDDANTWATLAAYGLDWILFLGVAIASWKVFAWFWAGGVSLSGYLLAVLIIASRQKGFENLIHEALHFSPNRQFNDILYYGLGAMWLHPCLTLEGERGPHIRGRHAFFWDPERDPKFEGHRAIGLDQLLQDTVWKATRVLALAFLRSNRWKFFAIASGSPFRDYWGGWPSVARCFLFAAVVAVLVYMGMLVPLAFYWVVPLLTLLPLISFLAQMSEHAGTRASTEFEMTRNKPGILQEHFFHPHGDGYHIVHHLYPGVLNHNLGQAHKRQLRRRPIALFLPRRIKE